MEIHATDDLSGVASAKITFASPSRGQTRIVDANFDSLAGIAQSSLTMPMFSEAGDWVVESIDIADNTGNHQILDEYELGLILSPYVNRLTPTKVKVISIQDVTPPQINNISVAPSAINVSSGSQVINVNLDLSDSGSGIDFGCDNVCYFSINLISPSGKQNNYGDGYNQATLISGNTQSGTWQIPVTIPRYAESGQWKIGYIRLKDSAGNKIELYGASNIQQALNFNPILTVSSSPSDTQPVQLTSFGILPNLVDTTTDSKSITLTAGATDNIAGIGGYMFEPYFNFVSPSGQQSMPVWLSRSLLAGTTTNGTWQGVGFLPQYSEAGTWKLNYGYIFDAAGNRSNYDAATLTTLGFPSSFEVILPSLVIDDTISDLATGGTVSDDVFGSRAQLVIPSGVLNVDHGSDISIDVLSADLHLPIPTGFTTNGTNFVNINLNPMPAQPFQGEGLTLVLPLLNQMEPGTVLNLYWVDPVSGNLNPYRNNAGNLVVGTVNADQLSATFNGVNHFTTVVGLIPNGTVLGDLDGDSLVNCADISIVKTAFGKKLGQSGFDSRADTNRDKVVNIRDLTFVSRKLTGDLICRAQTPATQSVPVAQSTKN